MGRTRAFSRRSLLEEEVKRTIKLTQELISLNIMVEEVRKVIKIGIKNRNIQGLDLVIEIENIGEKIVKRTENIGEGVIVREVILILMRVEKNQRENLRKNIGDKVFVENYIIKHLKNLKSVLNLLVKLE